MNVERQMEKSNRRNQRFMRDQFTHEDAPEDREKQTLLPSDLYLFMAMTSDERMETVIRCATDLGVYEIIPVEMSERDAADLRKVERARTGWQALADQVSREENRPFVPHVHRLVSFAEALVYARSYCEIRLAAYENMQDEAASAKAFKKLQPGKSVGIFIGPESGFTDEAVASMQQQGMDFISLGDRVLRNDTAAVCAMYLIVRELEK